MGTIVTDLQQPGLNDKLTDVLIREVNASVMTTAPYPRRNESR